MALKRAILAGKVSQRDAVAAERESLLRLRQFDVGACSLEQVLDAVAEYEQVVDVKRSYKEEYRRTLECTPWKDCDCGLCAKHGIEMAIFRGSERNKRRGFHNLSVLAAKMKSLRIGETSILERTACG